MRFYVGQLRTFLTSEEAEKVPNIDDLVVVYEDEVSSAPDTVHLTETQRARRTELLRQLAEHLFPSGAPTFKEDDE